MWPWIWIVVGAVAAGVIVAITVDVIRNSLQNYFAKKNTNWDGLKAMIRQKRNQAIDVGIFDRKYNVVETNVELRHEPDAEVEVEQWEVVSL